MLKLLFVAVLLHLSLAVTADIPYLSNSARPLVVAHRGACGDHPDHSAAAYTAAYYNQVDFNEPDLQVTKDNVLFIMHNPCMKETTNIEQIAQFANRRVNITYTGAETTFQCVDDYLVNDFTWQELIDAGLKVRNRYSKRNPFYNDLFPPMRLDDAIELMLNLNAKAPVKGKKFKTGLYIETKVVQFYKEQRNVDIAKLVFEVLSKYDIETVEKASKKLPIILESFEKESLFYFKNVTDLPRIQLMFNGYPYNLTYIAEYAHGVGPNYAYMFNYKNETFNLDKPSLFIEECHALGLKVHPWILQDDILHYSKNAVDEAKIWFDKGVDGYFTEFPWSTLSALEYFTSSNSTNVSFEQA